MKNQVHPIATITTTSGLEGDVRLRPLSRYFDDYIEEKRLMMGYSSDKSEDICLELVSGIGKKRRFKFKGINSLFDAKNIVGKTIFIETRMDDQINMISKQVLGYEVITDTGNFVGVLNDIMWLPNNDIYVIKNGNREFLIPVIPEVIKRLDHEQGIILITPMDGLLD